MSNISYRRCRKVDIFPARKLIKTTINHLRANINKSLKDWKITKEPPPLMTTMMEENPELFYCAWKGDKVVGFAGAYLAGKQWYLAWLFVHPKLQDKGVGRKLLEKVWHEGKGVTHSLCTFAYNPQAIGIYSQFGMVPLCDLPWMVAESSKINKLKPTKLNVSEGYTKADLKWVHQLESKIRGYAHPAHWDVWLNRYPFKLHILRNCGKRIGYFLIAQQGSITPLGVTSPKYMHDAMTEGIRKAIELGNEKVCLWCPTYNINLYSYLIELGFRVDELEIFMSDVQYVDWQRYVPATLAIL